MTTFNQFQTIKRRFFAFRNGVIADNLRKSGSPFKIIFGLNLPQLKEIAGEIGTNLEIAEMLWANTSTRESMLLAPMVYPLEKLSTEKADEMIAAAPDIETVDILCHFLLRKTDFKSLIDDNIDRPEPLRRYTALRLCWQLIPGKMELVKMYASNEFAKNEPTTKLLSAQLIEEVKLLTDEC